MIDKEAFLQEISEILEVDADKLSLDTDFRKDVPYWDSLKGFSILVLFEDEYGIIMTVDEFLQQKTLGDLFAKIDGRKTI